MAICHWYGEHSPMRVLYVEDDDNLAFAVERMLKQAGYDCDRARSGAGAVNRAQANDYDLILLDVMLPDIDGYEVLRQLQGAGVDTPVLIQSGLVERDKAMDGLGFGVDDYLIKPFNRDELIGRVRQVAARAGKAPPQARDKPTSEAPPATVSVPAIPAKILASDGATDIECNVVSVASGGAVLDVHDEEIACPDEFMLAVAGDKSYRCQSCWRHGDKVGVRFL